MTAPDTSTCAVPRPKMLRRISHNRDRFNSSPMTKSSSTTPSSATPLTRSASPSRPSANGPTAMPAAR
jgi:hypothetical protein